MRRTALTRNLGGCVLSWRSQAAQSLIEFALVVPIFLIILCSIFEFGRALIEFTSISNAAREGARAGIVQSKSISDITTAALSTTVTAGAQPDVTITAYRNNSPLTDPSTRQPGDFVQVQVSHSFRPIAFIANGYGPGNTGGLGVSIPMSSAAKMRVE